MFYIFFFKVKKEIAKGNFKPNCVLVVLQFMLQHSLLSPNTGIINHTIIILCYYAIIFV